MPAFVSEPFAQPLRRLRNPARLAVAAVLLWAAALPAQQVAPDQAADMLLTSAKTAYNAKDFAFAAGRFREFLAKFANHKDAVAAHYGLALALLDGPDKDYNARRRTAPAAGRRQGLLPTIRFISITSVWPSAARASSRWPRSRPSRTRPSS